MLASPVATRSAALRYQHVAKDRDRKIAYALRDDDGRDRVALPSAPEPAKAAVLPQRSGLGALRALVAAPSAKHSGPPKASQGHSGPLRGRKPAQPSRAPSAGPGAPVSRGSRALAVTLRARFARCHPRRRRIGLLLFREQ